MSGAQIGELTLLAGEKKDLAMLGQLHQKIQRGGHAGIIEGDKRVIQKNGDALLLGEDQIANRKADRQIQLVSGALTERVDLAGENIAALLCGGNQLSIQQMLIAENIRQKYKMQLLL